MGWAMMTYTMQSWTVLTVRLLCAGAGRWSGAAHWLAELLRYPAIVQNCTVGRWENGSVHAVFCCVFGAVAIIASLPMAHVYAGVSSLVAGAGTGNLSAATRGKEECVLALQPLLHSYVCVGCLAFVRT